MATLVFEYDHSHDPMSPAQLADEIETALALGGYPRVDIDQTSITVEHDGVTEDDRAAIQGIIGAYTYDPAWNGGPEGILHARAEQALTTNKAYLGHAAFPANPTDPQRDTAIRMLIDQVDALTRQTNAVIRVLFNELTDLSGT